MVIISVTRDNSHAISQWKSESAELNVTPSPVTGDSKSYQTISLGPSTGRMEFCGRTQTIERSRVSPVVLLITLEMALG